MPDPEVRTGEQDNGTHATGGSDDLEKLLFDDYDETGDDGDAGQDIFTEEESKGDPGEEIKEAPVSTEPELTPDQKNAFAIKLNAERPKMREEIRRELEQEMRLEAQKNQQYAEQGAPQKMSDEDLSAIADKYGITKELAMGLYELQEKVNRSMQREQQRQVLDRERTDYTNAKSFVAEVQAKNSSMPGWEEEKLIDYRRQYYRETAQVMPWKDAYRAMVADMVLSGEITRNEQQKVIEQIQGRDKETVKIQSPATQTRSIKDLPSDKFEELVQKAKTGAFKLTHPS